MCLRFSFLAAAFLAIVVPVARTEEKARLADGNWLLSTVGPVDQAVCILQSQTEEGKTKLTVVATPSPSIEATVTSVKSDKGLTFTLRTIQTSTVKGKQRKALSQRVFVAAPGKDPKEVFGSFGTDTFPQRAKLTATTQEKISTLLIRGPAADPMSKAQQLTNQPFLLRNKARLSKDEDEKKELKAKATKAQEEADEKLPGLYREVVAKYPESDAAFDAAQSLIRSAEKANVTAGEAEKLADLIGKLAEPYGYRYSRVTAVNLADMLVRRKGLEAVALGPITPIAKGLTEKDTLTYQYDILDTYHTALAAAGKADEAKAVEARLAKLDVALDKEYVETVPPFKPTAFGGRTEKTANRVAVMELFTGAQCGPCIAADVAFDALHAAYKPSDLVLIQYHMHIPGPDPLTNAATEARWEYYTDKFPYDPDAGTGVAGTPSTLLNGTPKAGGGGGMNDARAKFDEYRKLINPLIEKETPIKLTGSASRTGDKVAIAVEVAGVEMATDAKLRLLLVEDTVKYVGGNKVRFHHHVVRAMPGGADGVAVKAGGMKHTATADIAAIRKDLVKYLDEYAKNERPFPYPTIRPMEMKALKAIALVQNDKTGEVLQAVQMDVEGK